MSGARIKSMLAEKVGTLDDFNAPALELDGPVVLHGPMRSARGARQAAMARRARAHDWRVRAKRTARECPHGLSIGGHIVGHLNMTVPRP